ncbi:MAG: site-specific tyrosine recombinase XerC [Synergistetes bacterium ADurb.Bin520]|nr:MAG: site-specific tyrosine recombinase XerC [Synergistetes bacterium ADurb.Bin520]
MYEGEQKTGKSKNIPLNAAAKSALRRYLRTASPQESDAPLFPSRQRKSGAVDPIFRVMAWVTLQRATEATGIKGSIGTPALRKTFGHYLYKNGVDLTGIMRLWYRAGS